MSNIIDDLDETIEIHRELNLPLTELFMSKQEYKEYCKIVDAEFPAPRDNTKYKGIKIEIMNL